tara:strand:+ start:904 stop:1161 length:258 start_codon:yes stop_codon:yes gene_type:complete
LNIIRIYNKPDGYVEYVYKNNIVCANAHSNIGKYTIGMMRAMLDVLRIKGKVTTQLRYNYLIDFYKKHFEVTYLSEEFYIIRERN